MISSLFGDGGEKSMFGRGGARLLRNNGVCSQTQIKDQDEGQREPERAALTRRRFAAFL